MTRQQERSTKIEKLTTTIKTQKKWAILGPHCLISDSITVAECCAPTLSSASQDILMQQDGGTWKVDRCAPSSIKDAVKQRYEKNICQILEIQAQSKECQYIPDYISIALNEMRVLEMSGRRRCKQRNNTLTDDD